MSHRPARSALPSTLALIAAIACTLAAVPPCRAQDTEIDKLNALYSHISSEKRADLVLLSALIGLEAPPAEAILPRVPGDDPVSKTMLLPAEGPGWTDAIAWASAPSQRAALDALKRATDDEDGQLPMAFGLPYGLDAVADEPGGLDLIDARMYTDLGDPPLLATANHGYIPELDDLVSLVNIQATLLSSEGRQLDAVELLIDLLYLGRQMAGREFLDESLWGMNTMILALQRIRDVAYTDFRTDAHSLDDATLVQIIGRLDENLGFLRLDRLRFPRAGRFAGDQIVGLVFTDSDMASTEFGRIMARVGAGEHALTMFSQVPRWNTLSMIHSDRTATGDNIRMVQNDWAQRWTLDPFDPRLANQTYQDSLGSRRDAIVQIVFRNDAQALFVARRTLDTELTGTRSALAVLAYVYKHGLFPPLLASVRPHFLKKIDDDPFNPDLRARGGVPEFQYFVPIRDTLQGARVTTYPIVVDIIEPTAPNFQAILDETHFVLYSVGPDGKKDWAKNIREDVSEVFEGDYLIWPPTISLYRQHMREIGQLQ
ncbi:MAG: hypothetical protein IID31_00885 [Planctomycetes bacterium]|nr:hypothetical protein [Planctomycetota bacterium]